MYILENNLQGLYSDRIQEWAFIELTLTVASTVEISASESTFVTPFLTCYWIFALSWTPIFIFFVCPGSLGKWNDKRF